MGENLKLMQLWVHVEDSWSYKCYQCASQTLIQDYRDRGMHRFDAGTHWNDSEMHFEKFDFFLFFLKIENSLFAHCA